MEKKIHLSCDKCKERIVKLRIFKIIEIFDTLWNTDIHLSISSTYLISMKRMAAKKS